MPRPKGKPQYGWTVNGHMIDLRVKKKLHKNEIKEVTAEGWDDWYPVEPGEFSSFSTKHKQEELFRD